MRRISESEAPRSALFLNSQIRDWIHILKFSRLLGRSDFDRLRFLAAREIRSIGTNFDAVVAIPSHPLRSLLQVDLSWEWGRCVAEASQRPLLRVALKHTSLTHAFLRSPQKNLSPEERWARFEDPNRSTRYASARGLEACRILLVDDVLNTGCSFLEARETLEKAGHRVVAGLVLART